MPIHLFLNAKISCKFFLHKKNTCFCLKFVFLHKLVSTQSDKKIALLTEFVRNKACLSVNSKTVKPFILELTLNKKSNKEGETKSENLIYYLRRNSTF